jgi:hypothetical protein
LILLCRTCALYIWYSVDITSEEISSEKLSLSEELSVIWIYIRRAVLRGTVSEGVFSLEMQPFVQH